MKAWAIRHILWTYMEAFKGNRIREYLREMNQLPSSVTTLQKNKLQSLLTHCANQVPAYQAYQEELLQDMNDPDWDPAVTLRKLPILTKKRFNDHRDEYISVAADKTKLIANRSGGSTGEPTQFYIDRVTVEHYEAARWRGLSWYGIGIGDPSVMIWGSAIELNQMQTRKYLFKERLLKNRIMIPAYELKEDQLDQHLQDIHRFKPVYIYGYASALYLFARMMEKQGRQLDIPLKAVVSTAETLHPYQRELISEVFGCKVANEYGARDGGIIAFECPSGRMHISADNCILEVVDIETKQPLPAGHKGQLLITDLNNFAMPRLRYDVGDIAALSPDSCTCSLNLPVLDNIEGRQDDMFVTTSGTYVHGHYFNHIMRTMTGFRGFQVIQHSRESISIKLIKHEQYYTVEQEQTFVDGIRKSLGDHISLNITYVEDIPLSASGKIRYAIREFDLG